MQAWLDCEPVSKSQAAAAAKEGRNQWTKELAGLLKPYGETSDDIVRCAGRILAFSSTSFLLTPVHDLSTSYAVPQEVGKVGTESASFVHPVAERKDGIDAFFKQAFAKGAKPLTSTGAVSSMAAAGARRSKSASPEKKLDVKTETGLIAKDEKAAEAAFGRDLRAAVKSEAHDTAQDGKVKGKGKAKSEAEDEGQVILSDEDDEVVVVGSSPPPEALSPPIMVHSSPVNATRRLPGLAEVRFLV